MKSEADSRDVVCNESRQEISPLSGVATAHHAQSLTTAPNLKLKLVSTPGTPGIATQESLQEH